MLEYAVKFANDVCYTISSRNGAALNSTSVSRNQNQSCAKAISLL
jgi:hypothetical protein